MDVVDEHCDVQRQLPSLEAGPHDGLVQHLMLSGVPGQALEMYFPPEDVHDEVLMHTPAWPAAPVQAPLREADRARERVERRRVRVARACIFSWLLLQSEGKSIGGIVFVVRLMVAYESEEWFLLLMLYRVCG